MKLLVAFCLVAAVAAAPPQARASYATDNVVIQKYENNNLGLGNYNYAFEQSDGTKAEQYGQINNEGSEDETITVNGSFSWVAPNGVPYLVTYTAGKKGYMPKIEEGPGGTVPRHVLETLLHT